MKDRLTLALCVNASGDCKVKPLLVYHSKTPIAFNARKVIKDKFPVMWRSTAIAWEQEPISHSGKPLFSQTVKQFLEEKRLSLKCLLELENAPAHHPGLEEDILVEYAFIKVLYLSPNTTPLLQPMDQQVISNFKKSLRAQTYPYHEFLKDHFVVVICLKIIDTAWREVSKSTLNSTWK
ncbi:tigger transposable element-derived protein 1-like [Palaemon carinicauda]|uniref:tigger transposable element-derived protein 1-like n=1 Tax=Palaemon carinicauda TaxID=392227 RepID=UPI0035B5D220